MNWHNDQRKLPSLVCLSKLCLKFLYTHVVGNGINVYKIHISPAIAPANCASDFGVWHRPKNISYTQSKCTTCEMFCCCGFVFGVGVCCVFVCCFFLFFLFVCGFLGLFFC